MGYDALPATGANERTRHVAFACKARQDGPSHGAGKRRRTEPQSFVAKSGPGKDRDSGMERKSRTDIGVAMQRLQALWQHRQKCERELLRRTCPKPFKERTPTASRCMKRSVTTRTPEIDECPSAAARNDGTYPPTQSRDKSLMRVDMARRTQCLDPVRGGEARGEMWGLGSGYSGTDPCECAGCMELRRRQQAKSRQRPKSASLHKGSDSTSDVIGERSKRPHSALHHFRWEGSRPSWQLQERYRALQDDCGLRPGRSSTRSHVCVCKPSSRIKDKVGYLQQSLGDARTATLPQVHTSHDALPARQDQGSVFTLGTSVVRLSPTAAGATRHLTGLSVIDVAYLLHNTGFGTYAREFMKMGITGADLAQCTEEDLMALGVSFMPHRVRLLQVIQTYLSSSVPCSMLLPGQPVQVPAMACAAVGGLFGPQASHTAECPDTSEPSGDKAAVRIQSMWRGSKCRQRMATDVRIEQSPQPSQSSTNHFAAEASMPVMDCASMPRQQEEEDEGAYAQDGWASEGDEQLALQSDMPEQQAPAGDAQAHKRKSAEVLQRCYRGHRARTDVASRRAALRYQEQYKQQQRVLQQKREFEEAQQLRVRRGRSAAAIQRAWRASRARMRARRQREREIEGAVALQRLWRGHAARIRVRGQRLHEQLQSRLRHLGALQLQRVWRGHEGRERAAVARKYRVLSGYSSQHDVLIDMVTAAGVVQETDTSMAQSPDAATYGLTSTKRQDEGQPYLVTGRTEQSGENVDWTDTVHGAGSVISIRWSQRRSPNHNSADGQGAASYVDVIVEPTVHEPAATTTTDRALPYEEGECQRCGPYRGGADLGCTKTARPWQEAYVDVRCRLQTVDNSAAAQADSSCWIRYTDSETGSDYVYNEQTGESTWVVEGEWSAAIPLSPKTAVQPQSPTASGKTDGGRVFDFGGNTTSGVGDA